MVKYLKPEELKKEYSENEMMQLYSNISGSTCEKCPIGYYSNTNGLTSCKACDAGSTSNEERTFCI